MALNSFFLIICRNLWSLISQNISASFCFFDKDKQKIKQKRKYFGNKNTRIQYNDIIFKIFHKICNSYQLAFNISHDRWLNTMFFYFCLNIRVGFISLCYLSLCFLSFFCTYISIFLFSICLSQPVCLSVHPGVCIYFYKPVCLYVFLPSVCFYLSLQFLPLPLSLSLSRTRTVWNRKKSKLLAKAFIYSSKTFSSLFHQHYR